MVCLTQERSSHLEQREFIRSGGLFCVFWVCFCCKSNERNRYLLRRNWRAGMGEVLLSSDPCKKKVCGEVCQIVKRVKSSSGFVWPENHSTQRSEAGIRARLPTVPHLTLTLPSAYRNAEWPHPWGSRRAQCQVLEQLKARVTSVPLLCVWAELLLCWKGGCPAPHLPAAGWEDFLCAVGIMMFIWHVVTLLHLPTWDWGQAATELFSCNFDSLLCSIQIPACNITVCVRALGPACGPWPRGVH